MYEAFDFETIKNKAIEQLKAGKPLLGKDGAFAPLLESILNAALEGEMDAHLTEEERQMGNRRNGKMQKQVQTPLGEVTVSTPRDRNSSFDPQFIKKRETILAEGVADRIIGLYAMGNSTREISDWMEENLGNRVSADTICSVLNKLTLQKSKIKMKYSKKKYNYYSDDERMSYIREYLSSPESKSEFCKRHGFCAKLLTYWLNKYQIEDKDMGRSSKPVNSDAIDSSISELQKELSLLRAENRKLHRALADESLRHEACEELINLAESTYHIKVRKNSDAK